MDARLANAAEAVIYRTVRSTLTSGRANEGVWRLEFRSRSAPWIEPLMGWTASADPLAHLCLTFPSREAAIGYAQRQGLRFTVEEPATTRLVPRAYADQIARLRQSAPATVRPAAAPEPIQLPLAA